MAVNNFLKARESLIEQNQMEDAPCKGCPDFKEAYWPKQYKISTVQFNEESLCQLKCRYCAPDGQRKTRTSPRYRLGEILEEFQKRDYFDTNINVVVGNGEMTISPDRAEVYQFVRDQNAAFIMCTNAVKFDQQLCELISDSDSRLINVSLDSGTRETYAAVKGLDVFDKVIENILAYKRGGAKVVLKYIFVPENQNFADVLGFMDICRKVMPVRVEISTDLYLAQDDVICEDTIFWIRVLEKLSQENGFQTMLHQQFMGKKTNLEYRKRYTTI